MFVRNAWYVGAWDDELGDKPLARRICSEPIVLFRDAEKRAWALQDRCCHRAAPLHLGTVVEQGIQCGYHGLIIDGTGRCVHVPGQVKIPDSAQVRSYPVVEKDRFVWVWLGDPAKADPAKILDFPWNNSWPSQHDIIPIRGNYMLMVDNLMDLTHLGYLHARTIGGNPQTHVDAEMKTTRTSTGLKFVRHMLGSLPPPTYVKAAGFNGRIDRGQEFEFVAPNNVLQWTGAAEAGAGAEAAKRDGAFQFRLFHGLTPETESSCLYFWSIANGYRRDEPEVMAQLFRDIQLTFDEDKTMVEAQQARLDEFGENGLTDIHSDAARMYMRRTVERMIAEESPSLAAE
jgi:vanillate O-demethylase monooxygenase subunit